MDKPIDTKTDGFGGVEPTGTGKVIIGKDASTERPTCETCSFDDAEWPERFSDDFCGEHPDFPAYLESLKDK